MEPLLLRVDEAAHLLGIGRTRTYDLMRTEQLKSVKVFGARRVPRAAVDAYIQSLMEGQA